MSIATLTVDLVAKIGAFVSSLKNAESSATSTGAKIKKALTPDESVGKGFAAIGTAAVASMTAIAGATALAISKGIEYSGSIIDTSERLGMSTTATQEMFGAMEQLGISSDETTGIFEKLQKAMVDARDPSSKAAEAFKAIGVSADDLKNKSIDQIFTQSIDGISQFGDRTERAALSMDIFGKSSAKMGELTTIGKTAIDEAREAFAALGLTMDEDVLRAANDVGDNMGLVGKAFNVISTQITADLSPVLNGLTTDFAGLVGQFVESGDASRIVEQGLAIIDAAIGTVIVTVKTMMGIWYALQGVIQTVIGTVVNRVMTFVQTMGVLGDVISKVFSGEFGAAAKAAKSGWAQVKAADTLGMQAVVANAQEYAKKSIAAFNAAGDQIAGKGFTLANYEPRDPNNGSWYNDGQKKLPPSTEEKKKKGGGGGAAKAPKEAKDKISEEEKALERLNKAYDDQLLSYEQSMFMLGKSGELAAAQWDVSSGKFKDLTQAQKDHLLVQAEAFDLAKKNQEELDKKREDEERDLENAKKFTEELLFQLETYGKTADEIERANLARDLGSALETEIGQKAMSTLDALQAHTRTTDQTVEAMDGLRDAAKGFFSDVLSGSKSFKDALMDALDSFMSKILDMIAQNLIDSLLGPSGSTGGGKFGGLVQTGLNAFFGRATGGGVSAGSFHKVNENGPEILSMGGADYLLMGNQSGIVKPNAGGGGGPGMTINFAVEGRIDRRTQQQIANESNRQLSMARARA